MGSHFENWAEVTGPVYMGAGTSWEIVWLVVSVAMCVGALFMGAAHELDAYRRADGSRNGQG